MKTYKGFTIGERVHFGGVCIPDTWGKVVGIEEHYIVVAVETEIIRIHPADVFHENEQA